MEIKIDERVYPLFRKDLDRRRKLGEIDTASFTIELAGQAVPQKDQPVRLTSSMGIYFIGTVVEVIPIETSPTAFLIKCVGRPEDVQY